MPKKLGVNHQEDQPVVMLLCPVASTKSAREGMPAPRAIQLPATEAARAIRRVGRCKVGEAKNGQQVAAS